MEVYGTKSVLGPPLYGAFQLYIFNHYACFGETEPLTPNITPYHMTYGNNMHMHHLVYEKMFTYVFDINIQPS